MQIRDDLDTLPESGSKRRRGTALLRRLLPMSALAFWHDPMNPNLETMQIRLNLPENSDDEETLVGPLTI